MSLDYCPYCGDPDLVRNKDGTYSCGNSYCRRIWDIEVKGQDLPWEPPPRTGPPMTSGQINRAFKETFKDIKWPDNAPWLEVLKP